MIELYWCRYHKSVTENDYKLILPIGTLEDKLYCLNTDLLSKLTITIIRQNAEELNAMDYYHKSKWLKENCSEYSNAFRSLNINKLEIITRHKISSLSKPDQISEQA